MTTQPDLFSQSVPTTDGVTDADMSNMRAQLFGRGWLTRDQVATELHWPVRKVRAVAQSLGGQIIRCQAGYKLTVECDRDDVPMMQQAADAAGSQSRIQRSYELEVRKAIHALVG